MSITEKSAVHFKGVKIDNIDYQGIYEAIKSSIARKDNGYICLTDVANVIGATQDPLLCQAINASLISVADGMPLKWFARLVGCSRIERVAGVDLMTRVFREKDTYRHYLLGDTEQIIARVINGAKRINSGINITGHSPPFKEFDETDNQAMFDRINKTGADIVWVCFGGGKQEKWMYQNIGRLDGGVMIGVGAAFRYFVGDLKIPPRIFQKMGLQWFFRMMEFLLKNGRLPKRQTERFPVFIANFPREVLRGRKNRTDLPMR